MRINESRIRQIIREEVESAVDEMAHAGTFEPEQSPDTNRVSFQYGNQPDNDSAATLLKHRSAAEKFARSGRFKTLAEKHLANIPHSVWFAPLIGSYREVWDNAEGTRMKVMPVKKGLELLKSLGYKGIDGVGSSDVVVLYTSATAGSNPTDPILATPWMIFHAMFDNMDNNLCPSYVKLYDRMIEDDLPDMDVMKLAAGLTMKSAREGWVRAPTDLIAEMMCQELLTSQGLQVDIEKIEDDELSELMEEIVPVIKKSADQFRNRMKGKLFLIAVN
jgi:hypothetical protein